MNKIIDPKLLDILAKKYGFDVDKRDSSVSGGIFEDMRYNGFVYQIMEFPGGKNFVVCLGKSA